MNESNQSINRAQQLLLSSYSVPIPGLGNENQILSFQFNKLKYTLEFPLTIEYDDRGYETMITVL